MSDHTCTSHRPFGGSLAATGRSSRSAKALLGGEGKFRPGRTRFGRKARRVKKRFGRKESRDVETTRRLLRQFWLFADYPWDWNIYLDP